MVLISISLFSVFIYFFQSLSTISQFSRIQFIFTINFPNQFLINIYSHTLISTKDQFMSLSLINFDVDNQI